MTKTEVLGQIVRVKTRRDDQLGLFACSGITVGDGVAGEFLDNREGNVIPIVNMIEVIDREQADKEFAQWKANKERSRIKEVVKSVEDSQEEFSGNIILHVAFEGSLAKTKALTKPEKQLTSTEMAAQGIDPAKIKGAKTLFESDEYDAIENFKNAQRAAFANLGIPFPLGSSMYMIKITNIPKAEELVERTQARLKELVQALVAVYPGQITPAAVGLGPLYNPNDYKDVSGLKALFKFKSKWMHFGTPDVLKEIDLVMWNRERQRTAAVWREAKEEGLVLLRQTTADLVARLVEALKPNEQGEKKRFFASSVTNLTDFFDVFEDRNIAGDTELSEQIQKLKDLVQGKGASELKNDDALRAYVQTEGAKIQEKLQGMIVSSKARTISLTD